MKRNSAAIECPIRKRRLMLDIQDNINLLIKDAQPGDDIGDLIQQLNENRLSLNINIFKLQLHTLGDWKTSMALSKIFARNSKGSL